MSLSRREMYSFPQIHNGKSLRMSADPKQQTHYKRILVFLLIMLAGVPCTPVDAGERLYWMDALEMRPPSTPGLIARGESVYNKRCVLCHGNKGFGNGSAADTLPTRPRDFSTGLFKFLTTLDFPSDEDLFRSITVGFPAFGMPEFTYLSARERWGLVYYVKELGRSGFQEAIQAELIEERLGFSSGEFTLELTLQHRDALSKIQAESRAIALYRFEAIESIPASRDIASRLPSLGAGKEAYFRLGCNRCHGDTGRADGPSAPTLLNDDGRKTSPRDFSGSRWHFKAGERAEDIVRVLIAGMPGTPMPSYYHGPDSMMDLWSTARYVRSLANLDETNLGEAEE